MIINRYISLLIRFAFLFCLLFPTIQAWPQTPDTASLTLDEALDEAYQANPALKAATAQGPIAQGGIIQAKTRVNPKLTLQAAPVENTYHPVDLAATVQLGGKRALRVRVAKFQLDSTNAAIRTVAWKVRQDTEQAFYEAAISQRALSVLQDYLQVAERLVEITQKKRAVGDVAGLDVLRAEAALADVRTQVAPAQARVHQAQRQLNLLLGKPAEDPISIVSPDTLKLQQTPPQLPDFNDLISKSRQARPEYKQYAADIATQKAKIKLANAARWPDVQIGGGLSMVPQSRNHYWGENFSYGPEFYAQIPLPVLDYQQGPKAIALATANQLESQTLAFDTQVQQELNVAYSNLEAAQAQLAIFITEILPKQKEIVTTSQRSYGLGFIDLTAAITAQQTALTARTSALQALSRYFQARIDMERAVGEPLAFEDLASPGVKQP